MNEPEYSLIVSPPALIRIKTPDESASFDIDVFEAWRFLEEAKKTPTEQARWEKTTKWLAGKWKLAENHVSESMAREVADNIYSIGTMLDERLKKKLGNTMQSLLHTTPTSQANGSTGQIESSEPTSITSLESLPSLPTADV